MHTQVAIIGAGPAGLLLAHQLHQAGMGCVVLEARSRDYVEARIRAGILEQTTVELLRSIGVDRRLDAEGLVHDGFVLSVDGSPIRIDLAGLVGRAVTVYGQTEVTRDLIEAGLERGIPILFEAGGVSLHDVTSGTPTVRYSREGRSHVLACDFIAGCDGFHGASRRAMPADTLRPYEKVYPFGWLGILADVPPCHDEVIYANTDAGFALASMRSRTRSRYYIQVPMTERLEDWPEDRLWDELEARFAPLASRPVVRGPALEMSIAPLRSYVSETMRRGRLLLAGDAAHVVPPTGAKGLNLAASDVAYLSEALIAWHRDGNEAGILAYAPRALARIWKAERFSWSLTKLMHRFPADGAFERRMQVAELDYLAGSTAMQTVIAENYVGLPLQDR